MTDTNDIPPPSEEWKKEQPWEDDSLAQFEAEKDPLDAQLVEQDKRNKLRFKRVTGRIIVWTTYLLWGLFASGLIVWVWHYVTPWEFLTPDKLAKLQGVVFSGALGAIASSLAKNYIGR